MSDIAINELNNEQEKKDLEVYLVKETLLDGDIHTLSPETSQRANYTIEDLS